MSFLFLEPIPQKRWPLIAAFVAVGLVGWAAFLLVVTNQEKLSSSVVRQIMRTVKDSKELREMLGEAIRPQPAWWLNGDPWIEGSVSTRLFLS
jgi:cytochrome c oxidase assembly factor 1